MKYITHTPTAKDFKIWVALAVFVFLIPGICAYYFKFEHPAFLIAVLCILGFFIFNLVVRKSPSMKGYFTSKMNFLTDKNHFEQEIDLPQELAFEKIVEVVGASNFKLVAADKERFEILAVTKMTLKSWGENLYITFEDGPKGTRMKLCSVTLFQIYSWGKNEKNFRELTREIEDSFTI